MSYELPKFGTNSDVMLADMNIVYVTFFKKDRIPARSAFSTSGLALNARVEIECIAVLK